MVSCVMAENNSSVLLPYGLYGNISNGTYPDGTLIKVVGNGVVYDWFNPVEVRNNTFGDLIIGDILYVQGNVTDGQNMTIYINNERADIMIDGVWYETFLYESGNIDNVVLRKHVNINQSVTQVVTIHTSVVTTIPTTTVRTTRPTTVRTYSPSYVGGAGSGGGYYILDYNEVPTESVVVLEDTFSTFDDVNVSSENDEDGGNLIYPVTSMVTYRYINVNDTPNTSDEDFENATTIIEQDGEKGSIFGYAVAGSILLFALVGIYFVRKDDEDPLG